MEIDWAATGAMIAGIGSFASAGAVLYAAKKGADTFAAWKRQKVEERRMHEAERILTLAYRLRSNFAAVSTRGMLGVERTQSEAALDKSYPNWRTREDREQSNLALAQTIFNRLAAHKDDWQEIWAVKPVALALFGEKLERTLHGFWDSYVTIEVAASMLAEDTGHDPEFSKSLKQDIFGGGDNDVKDRIAGTIAELERDLLPILRGS